ncbi:methionyl-tRNA formyltransferase [Buchnera aphidicola (Pemphigus obesinymphae)]|uniref:methionyl-tRNA formyltransferase n=1 Tax=Buchnera aphidicola TaxID=9 RepID=UPI002238BC79|nr:methionyl-tRNA formyltransferase [Buchnera aphidicola]MCW5196393.1 methionyl-tRNA formyltransferase [Buchnera aphidicola (Pemphigus obesinymphae)]
MIYYSKKNIKKNKKIKIIFAGTPNFASAHLHALLISRHQVVAVLTKPDSYFSRNKKKIFSPVKTLAQQNCIPVFQPITLNNTEIQNILKKLNADIMLVVAYGIILPENILNLFPLGCINIHASLLPRWRGPAPIQWAILNGDKKTGISIIKMDKGIDTGKILYSTSCSISLNDTYSSLEKKLIKIGIQTILIVLNQYFLNTYKYTIQDNISVTYANKIKKEQGKLNWNNHAIKLERSIRAFNPWPTAFFIIHNKLIKVWEANVIYNSNKKKAGEIILANKNGIQINTKNGILNITKLQISGKKIMSVLDFLNSKKEWFVPGKVLN